MSGAFSRPLLGIILVQVCIHSSMAGMRMAAPLHALRGGQPAWTVGLLLALFAVAPIALALRSGRLADRWGFHRPIRLATGVCVAGGLLATLSQSLAGPVATYVLLCTGALCAGAAANMVVIASQRTAGMMAADNLQRVQVFSWLGLAPALSNAIGPVLAGLLIDAAGFQAAFGVLALLPFAALHWARRVPARGESGGAPAGARAARPGTGSAGALLRAPARRRRWRLYWLLSARGDMHAFLLPILGHERGLSASAIGTILGLFAGAVTVVRLAIPLLVHRLSHAQVLTGAMLLTAAVFSAYPFVRGAPAMAFCAVLLGLALGSVQPMIMSTLHHITPDGHHGEVIALRSMVVNLSSSVMPVLFGAAGTALGVGTLFWAMGAVVASGSLLARRIAAWARPA